MSWSERDSVAGGRHLGGAGRPGRGRARGLVLRGLVLMVAVTAVLAGAGAASADAGAVPLQYAPGQLDLGGCSGSIVRFPTSYPTDSAMMLTAAHCIGRADGGAEQLVDAAPAQSSPIRLLDGDGGEVVHDVKVARIMYAGNMDQHDIAIARLANSFAFYQDAYGVKPLTIASSTAAVGQHVLITSGAWQQQTTCPVSQNALEANRAIRAEPCLGVGPGWSGSPFINTDTGRVVSLASVFLAGGHVQGPDVSVLLRCVTAQRTLNLMQIGCPLDTSDAGTTPLRSWNNGSCLGSRGTGIGNTYAVPCNGSDHQAWTERRQTGGAAAVGYPGYHGADASVQWPQEMDGPWEIVNLSSLGHASPSGEGGRGRAIEAPATPVATNTPNGLCLDGNTAGAVYSTPCQAGDAQQQWVDFVYGDNGHGNVHVLMNVATQRILQLNRDTSVTTVPLDNAHWANHNGQDIKRGL